MSTYTTDPAAHLGDDELLRLIDNDGDDAWRAPRDGHLAACELCTRELALLSGDAGVVREWLDRAAFEDELPARMPRLVAPASAARRDATRPVTPWLRAAAVLLMLAAPVAALPALRGWIVDTVTGRDVAPAVRTMAAPPEAAADAAIIRFVPLPGSYTIAVDAPEAGGVLRIRYADGTEAMFHSTALAAGPTAEVVVGEQALRLRNAQAAPSSHVLELPANVTRLVISIGGTVRADLDAAALRRGAEVPLDPR